MANIAFILLCHKDPDAIIEQAQRLTAAGDYMSIHFDARSPHSAYKKIREELAANNNVTFAKRRVKCGWGEWSLVEASLEALRAAAAAFPRATHFYMLSGDCMAIKPAEYIHAFLDANDSDFIETNDFFKSDWIKTGIREERLTYRHWFNERRNKKLFYASMNAQRWLGLARKIPKDLDIQIGSQWWCLRRQTAEAILEFCNQRRDVMRFFRTTWIPDETFFQTLVAHLVPRTEIENRTLTFLMFSDYGMPVTFYNDHYDLLIGQDYLFARKISPEAADLKKRLGALYASTGIPIQISNEGRALHKFLTGQGREGRRFAPRFWEAETSLGRDREMLIILCKKWHVAKRLLANIGRTTGVPTIEYLFNEEGCILPDLGGIEASLVKRHRHRRALMRMLFDFFETDKLIICMDPGSQELIMDFYGDRAVTRFLEIDCSFSDEYLIGHARRVGLAGEATPQPVVERLLPTIRNNFRHERERIHDAKLEYHYRIGEWKTPEENAAALAGFLSSAQTEALSIIRAADTFAE